MSLEDRLAESRSTNRSLQDQIAELKELTQQIESDINEAKYKYPDDEEERAAKLEDLTANYEEVGAGFNCSLSLC